MQYLKTIRTILDNIIEYALDIIAPQDPCIREIEHMQPTEFIQRAKRAQHNNQIKDILYFFSYQDPLVKSALLEVKSYGNQKIAALLGAVLYELMIEELSDIMLFENIQKPLCVPVPMTKRSERKRGHNQCTLILKHYAKHTPHTNISLQILLKIKETGDQVGKTRTERFKNLKHCFKVKDNTQIAGKDVIVFDDIVTTGATLYEARKALKSAGARKVILIALAH